MNLSKAAVNFQESAIRRIGALSASTPGLISLAAGYPAPEVFPWEDLQSITAQILARHDGNTLTHTLQARGISAMFEDVIITSGSQQGLDLIGRVLIDPGDPVIVELPTYSGAIAAFHNLQASLAGVPQDAEGIDIQQLDRVAAGLEKQGRPAKFVYVTPNFQNPAGLLMSARRRRGLLDAAHRHGLVILEDDPYGSIYFEDATKLEDTRPIKADDAGNRVIYLGSFSKILVPGLRVAWMVAPREIAQKVELCKQAADISSGVFDQRIVHGALAGGVIDRIAPGLRAHYQAKRTVMERALHSHLEGRVRWISPRGGFFLWIEMPGIDDRQLLEKAVAEKVSFVPGSAFFVDGQGHAFARLAFSGISHEMIEQAIERLTMAIKRSTD
jgi:2-aminoadipate transaminase